MSAQSCDLECTFQRRNLNVAVAAGSPTLRVDPLDKGKVSEVAPEDPVHQVT